MRWKNILIVTMVLFIGAGLGYAARTTLISFDTGGDQITVRALGEIEVESTGIIDIESGGEFRLAGTNIASGFAAVPKLKLETLASGDTLGMVGGEIWMSAKGDSIYTYTTEWTIKSYAGQ